jgi:branched-chain amino acid transport system ATP-binding protein
MSSIVGTALSAMFLVLVPEFLRSVLEYRMLAFGIVMVAVVVIQEKVRAQIGSRKPVSSDKENPKPVTPNVALVDSIRRALIFQDPVLCCTDLRKNFDGLRALSIDTLKIPANLITGLMGPNGAGKTTLFNCVSGIYPADSGVIRFENKLLFSHLSAETKRNPASKSPARLEYSAQEIARLGIARTFQRVRLFNSLTVEENILLGALCGEEPRFPSSLGRIIRSGSAIAMNTIAAQEAMSFARLTNVSDVNVDKLPLEAQRRVEIARAIATHSSLLLLDEPAAGLSESEKDGLRALLLKMKRELGVTIVLIEHDMSVLMQVSDRVVCMYEGKILRVDTPTNIRANAEVQQAYLGPSE